MSLGGGQRPPSETSPPDCGGHAAARSARSFLYVQTDDGHGGDPLAPAEQTEAFGTLGFDADTIDGDAEDVGQALGHLGEMAYQLRGLGQDGRIHVDRGRAAAAYQLQ